jgi:hypothetical protein
VISDKVLISGYRSSCEDGLSFRCVRAQRTIEGTEDQTLWAQFREMARTELLSALGAAWHRTIIVAAIFKLFVPR